MNGKKISNLLMEISEKKELEEFQKYINLKNTGNKIPQILILINQLIRLNYEFKLDDNLLNLIPRQYFKIYYQFDHFKFEYQHSHLMNMFHKILKELILKEFNFNMDIIKNNSIHGYIIEGLIILLFEVNKLILDLKFTENNIIEVEEIYNINNENRIEGIDVEKPVLIKQKNIRGKDYDFVIIYKKEKINHGILIQVGLNKKKNEISKIYINSVLRSEILKKGIFNTTGIKIDKLCLLFIFDNEKQNELINEIREKKRIKYTNEEDKKKRKKKRNYYEYTKKDREDIKLHNLIGVNVCKNFKIPYFLFSHIDIELLHNKNEIIDNINSFQNLIWPILELSTIFNLEINIQLNQILNQNEIYLLKHYLQICCDLNVLAKINNNKIISVPSMFLIVLICEHEKIISYTTNDNNKECTKYLMIKNEEITILKKINNFKIKESYLIEIIFKDENQLFEEDIEFFNKKLIKTVGVSEQKKNEKKRIYKSKSVNKKK